MIQLVTLRDFADRHSLHCYCHNCGRNASVSWSTLAAKYGWELAVSSLANRLACRKCGSKNTGITIAFDQISHFNYAGHTPSDHASAASRGSVRQFTTAAPRLRSA